MALVVLARWVAPPPQDVAPQGGTRKAIDQPAESAPEIQAPAPGRVERVPSVSVIPKTPRNSEGTPASPAHTDAQTHRLRVLRGRSYVADCRVELFDGHQLLETLSTGKHGTARFTLPAGALSVRLRVLTETTSVELVVRRTKTDEHAGRFHTVRLGGAKAIGTVWTEDGEPWSGVDIILASHERGASTARWHATSDRDGRVHFEGLEAGRYRVCRAGTRFDSLSFRLEEGVGRYAFDLGRAPDSAHLAIRLLGPDGTASWSKAFMTYTRVDDGVKTWFSGDLDCAWNLHVKPGRYKLEVRPGSLERATTIDVPRDGARVDFHTKGSAVRGKLVELPELPPGEWRPRFHAVEVRRRDRESPLMRSAWAGHDGRFEIADLRAGNYELWAGTSEDLRPAGQFAVPDDESVVHLGQVAYPLDPGGGER